MWLALAAILLVLWLGGFFLNVVGNIIHIVLVLAVVAVVAHFVLGARGRAV